MTDEPLANSSQHVPPSLPAEGRIAGVDFGTVRIGVAVCDPERRFASPLENYARRGERQDAEYFQRLADLERIVGWVVGLPVHGHGGESQKSQEARRFGEWLARTTRRPVAYFDERYTTVQADEFLDQAKFTRRQKQERRDKLAAQILLTAFLESPHRVNSQPESLE